MGDDDDEDEDDEYWFRPDTNESLYPDCTSIHEDPINLQRTEPLVKSKSTGDLYKMKSFVRYVNKVKAKRKKGISVTMKTPVTYYTDHFEKKYEKRISSISFFLPKIRIRGEKHKLLGLVQVDDGYIGVHCMKNCDHILWVFGMVLLNEYRSCIRLLQILQRSEEDPKDSSEVIRCYNAIIYALNRLFGSYNDHHKLHREDWGHLMPFMLKNKP